MLNELELEEEALELSPAFAKEMPKTRRANGHLPTQAPTCPKFSGQTVSRFPRHANAVNSLPQQERDKIKASAALVLGSFRPGCRPVLNIGIVGHADKDPQGTGFEKRISEQRAAAVQQAVQGYINDPKIVSRIKWQVMGAGADSLIVPNAKTESERARNRRVEIFLGSIPLDGLIKGVTVDGRGASIRFEAQTAPRAGEFNFDLYRDQPGPRGPLLPRTEWMRRGAMLGLAQRALTNSQRARLVVTNDLVQSIEVYTG